MAVKAENEHLRWLQLAGCLSRPPVRVRLLSDFINSNIPHHLFEAASSCRLHHSPTHSPAVHFTSADTSPASISSHLNYLWMILAPHIHLRLCYFLPPSGEADEGHPPLPLPWMARGRHPSRGERHDRHHCFGAATAAAVWEPPHRRTLQVSVPNLTKSHTQLHDTGY